MSLDKSPKVVEGIPRLDAKAAYDACRAESAASFVSNAVEKIDVWSGEFVSEENAGATVETCPRGTRREFPLGSVFDMGDGGGPEFQDKSLRADIATWIAEITERGCSDPLLVTIPWRLDTSTIEFARGVRRVAEEVGYPGTVAVLEWPIDPEWTPRGADDTAVLIVGQGWLQPDSDDAP